MAKWVEATITKRIDWAEGLVSLRFKADLEPYKAGQYATVALNIDGKRIARPFSYISAPHEEEYEIYIVLVPDGYLSPSLYKLQIGDSMSVMEHSHGFFTLDEVPDTENLWLIATGTGLAPYISMLRGDEIWRRFQRIILIHGVRRAVELTYKAELQSYKDSHPEQLSLIPFVSRESAPGTLEGRIPAALQDGRLESKTGSQLSPDNHHLMLCGNPDMVKDVLEILAPRGFEKNLRRKPGHITTEKYWT